MNRVCFACAMVIMDKAVQVDRCPLCQDVLCSSNYTSEELLKLKEVRQLIQLSDALTLDSGPVLTSWDASDMTGHPENECLNVTWTDEEGRVYGSYFTEAGFLGAYIKNDVLFMQDREGELCKFHLFGLVSRLIKFNPKPNFEAPP